MDLYQLRAAGDKSQTHLPGCALAREHKPAAARILMRGLTASVAVLLCAYCATSLR